MLLLIVCVRVALPCSNVCELILLYVCDVICVPCSIDVCALRIVLICMRLFDSCHVVALLVVCCVARRDVCMGLLCIGVFYVV